MKFSFLNMVWLLFIFISAALVKARDILPGGAVDSSAWLEFTFYGNLLLYKGYSVVWRSNTYDQGITSASLENSGSDYGEVSDQSLIFLKLDFDGNLRMYSSSINGRGSKNVTWAAVTDQCKVFGYCGDFGVCRYDEISGNPFCGCPSQDFFLNKSNEGRNAGCERKMDIQKCQTTMLSMDNTLFLTYPPETDEDSSIATAAACRSNCLNDSSCVASTFLANGTGTCYMKRSSFIRDGFGLPESRDVVGTTSRAGATAPGSRVRGWTVGSKPWSADRIHKRLITPKFGTMPNTNGRSIEGTGGQYVRILTVHTDTRIEVGDTRLGVVAVIGVEEAVFRSGAM
ncbi:hypothetical protein SASPL_150193 [Salvia splendens]|uniref:Apple domain-containing protein n=1 Tax=Salvia splendens TaxID=180675 RepID=A0A8X8W6F2_SALSN|nr:hypothetical protein SASPL_150193 [Salvia splendens]